jgi:uncharacterized membrane protein
MMIVPPEALVTLLKPWNDFYSHSKLTETIVLSLHVGGVLLGGGLAIAADRGTLRALRVAAAERPHYTRELAAVHRWVLTGLTIVVLSGIALVTSDIETFWGSWIYVTKMALFVVLLINGLMMTRAETALRRDASESSAAWTSLHRTAVTSIGLWFAIAVLGIALVNYS